MEEEEEREEENAVMLAVGRLSLASFSDRIRCLRSDRPVRIGLT